jgi:threonine dehydratase
VLARGDAHRPLVTASAGNHGKALAHAARIAGIPLTVYVPESAPRAKKDAIRQMGAELIACTDYDDAESRAKRHAADGAAEFISPYSHADVIAGAGTIGLEILEQHPDVDSIIVPIGGGGLISGIAIAVKAQSSHVQVVGVEVEASCPFRQGLAAGRIVSIDVQPTLADGLSGNLDPDTVTFDIVRTMVDLMTTVNEEQLRQAMSGIVQHERLIAEAAGATGVAAILGRALPLTGRQTVVIVSGANVDQEVLASLI